MDGNSTDRNADNELGRSGGQAALRRRMAIDPDLRNRSTTGAVLWSVQAVIAAVQQYGRAGSGMPATAFYLYLGVAASMALLCLFVGPRLGPRSFRFAEEVVVVAGWLATAALVAATGGASSADIGLFANVMFYCAYFMEPARAARQVVLGTALMWAPVVYDFSAVASSGFLGYAVVMTTVLWAMVILIARHRRVTIAAEIHARRLALSDPLTGVANLHTFNDELRDAVRSASEDASRLGVAFVDVNGLKAANTVYGHAGGDLLIRRTAEALLESSGVDDQVARIGGDEFAVIVSDADADRMKDFEADFALALERQGGEGANSIGVVSASIGTAVFPEDGNSPDQLMAVADGRMYDSKAALPQRLPTPGTSGGRSLSDAPVERVGSKLETLMTGDAPGASIAWLIAASMIAAGAAFGSVDVHPRLAFTLAVICVMVAGVLALVPDAHRRRTENASNALAVVMAIPAIYATGGAATPILPLAYLVVAHAAYALSPRAAAVRAGAMLGILIAVLVSNVDSPNFTGVSVIVGEVIVIAGILRFNRSRADAAERASLELSRIDALTRLANRRMFERSLAIAATRLRSDTSDDYDDGGLVLIDVDDFKAINSSGGHKAGDEVLRMIASVLEGAVGEQGTVCRIGGDEFAIVVSAGDGGSLARLAEKTRAAIGVVDWRVLCEPKVTLSMGYATWQHVDQWKDIVIAADMALRASKSAGKNAVTSGRQDASGIARIGPDTAAAV